MCEYTQDKRRQWTKWWWCGGGGGDLVYVRMSYEYYVRRLTSTDTVDYGSLRKDTDTVIIRPISRLHFESL